MLGDLWALGLAPDLAWEELDPDGRAPHVRCSQAVAAVGDDIFFVGGSYYKCASVPPFFLHQGHMLPSS